MASHNDHRTQQQSWVPKGGGGWKRNVSSSHQSEINFNSKKQQEVIHRLQDMFMDVLDLDVIQSVAQNCEFNLHASIEALMTLSEDVDIRKSPVLGNTMTFFNTASPANPQTKKLNIPELPLQAKTRNETKHAMFLAPGSLVHKSQTMTGRDTTLSPTQGAIKVTYKTPSNCEESDSDADVVVEEEKEYDVAGGSVNVGIGHGSFPRLEAPSSLLPHSMTHLSDGHRRGKSPKSKKTAQMSPVSPAVIRPPNVKTSVDVPSKKLSSAHLAQQKQVKPPTVQERVQRLIQGGTRVMVLMRGAPGSGKTHLATQIVRLTMGDSCNPSSFVFSTDDFFVRSKRFIPSLLQEAHSWNQKRVCAAAERKWSPIFVDNTNTEVWEMKPYAEFAVRNGYVLELVEPSTPWRYQESQLARRNVHGVPYPQIQAMLARFERNLTGKLLLTKLKLKYAVGNTPPQPAANPLPPQVKPKAKKKNKKAQAITVIPPEVKPKKKRKRKSKSATQPSQAPEQPAKPAQFSSVMDTLAVFLAKKALEEGRTLDPEIANSRLNNGVTLSDVLLQEKQGMPPLADSCGAVKKWTTLDSVSSQKSAVDVNAQTEDDSSSGEDSSDDDDEDHEEEEDEVWDSDIDNDEVEPESKDLSEWQHDDDNEWLYQSDDNAQGDEGLNRADNPESVPTEVQCWEYILVMDDSKWVYQKHHPETQDIGVQEHPDATTEQAEDLLIDLSAGAADVTVSQNSLNAECRAAPETSNLLIDILGDAEDNLENGVQQLLPPMNVPLVAEIRTKQSDSEVAVPAHSFSLAEFDQWLSTVPVETGVEAIQWETPSSETSTAASPVKELTQESIGISAAAVPVTADDTAKTVELCPPELEISSVLVPLTAPPVSKDVSDEAGEVCPLGLRVSTSVVPSDKKKQMPENAEGHVLKSDLFSGTDILLAEGCENHLFLLEGAELKLVSTPGTHEPCAGASNNDRYHNAVSSEEASSSYGREQCVEASDLKSLASVQPAPSYDLLTWVMKCKEEGPGETEEVWGQEDLLVNSKEVHTKPDNLCGPREQRSHRRVVERKEESGDAEVQKEVEPPEVQAWDTVPEPSGTWENKHTEQEEHKLSAGPQPQRTVLVAAESYQTEQSGSGKRLVSSRTPTLLTPDDFMQCSWENRLVSKLQSNGSSAVGAQCCDVTDSVAANADTSTNTHYKDFSLLSQLNRHQDVPEPMEGIRIITGHNRSINEGISPLTLFDRPVPLTLTLDKSSMTNEEDITSAALGSSQAVNEERNRNFMQLANIFPNAPQDGLKEIFDKCCGDLDWAIDLLLESKLEQLTPLAPPNDTEDSVFQELSFPVIGVSNQEASAPPVQAEDKVPPCTVQTTRQWRRESGRKAPLSEESQQLKRYLEENVTFSGASYPEHTLRIRKLWHGEPLDMGEVTTKPEQSSPNNTLFVEESCLGAIGSSGTRTPTPHARDALDVHKSDVAVDVDMDSSSSGTEEEDMLPITLDPGFVSLLYQKFGDPFLPYSEGMERVVNLPLPLARQIYYYLMESQLLLQEQHYKQMEQMLREDEELARQLQEQEEKQQGTPAIPDLQEIMDMEMALALYRSDQEQMQEKDDDLATKLKKQKLCELFPNLDRGVLLELFTAHENSFERTLEEVMASTGNAQEEHVQTVIAPEALVAHERSLMEQAKQEQCKVDQENKSGISKPLPIVVVRDPTDDNTLSLHQKAMKVVEQYRAEARHHKQLRDERFHKAKEAFQKGRTAIANYYLQMAMLHKQRMDKANAEAVTFLQSAHTIKQDKVTLDLHYYQVPEALQVLDVFLDEHIATLADQHTKKNVFIITGRGVHSSGGKSRIRPAVESRLKKRGLKWSVENPGLLKVVVKSYFPMSHTVGTNS